MWVGKLTSQLEFESDKQGKEFKVEAIYDSAVYSPTSESGILSDL